jgi:hypothetical protein
MFRKIMFLAALLFLIAPTLRAQQPSLAGTWRLNLAKSDYGDLQGPETRTDVIEQSNGRITETVNAEGRHRKQQYTLTFATDGQSTTLPPGIRMGSVAILSVSARWRGDALIVTQHLKFQDAQLVATNTYTLSEDHNTLAIALSLDGGNGAEATFVFDRVLANPL